jgi:hypothetical protein
VCCLMGREDDRRAANVGNVLKVAERLVSRFRIDDGNQGERREVGNADGLSVRHCGDDLLCSQNTAGPRTIFDDERLAQALR